MTNREYMVGLLQDQSFIDDGGASYEAMVYYNVDCPYYSGDERCECEKSDAVAKGQPNDIDRETCFWCKHKWLDSEVDA